jgi:hypothetical protein
MQHNSFRSRRPAWRAVLPLLGLAALLSASAVGAASPCFGSRDLASPDGALVLQALRLGRGGCGEVTLEIQDQDGRLLLTADFTSSDGEHGEGLIDAVWSRDSQFLVLSLGGAGTPPNSGVLIEVYRRASNKLVALDGLDGGKGIVVADPAFTLTDSDVLVLRGANGVRHEIALGGK